MKDAPPVPVENQELNLCISENGLMKLRLIGGEWEKEFPSLFKAFRFAEALSLFGNLRLIVSDGRGTVFYELTV